MTAFYNFYYSYCVLHFLSYFLQKNNPLSSFLYQFYEFDRVHNEIPKFG